MKLVQPSFVVLTPSDYFDGMLARIEVSGRVCYKSEDRITVESAPAFVSMLIKRGHTAMLEHGGLISVLFHVDRGVANEIVRHRIASYAQSSTRYCDYSKGRFGGEVTFIDARPHLPAKDHDFWVACMGECEAAYLTLRERGVSPQMARSVLPLALKTEIVVSMNPTAWRHFFALRIPATAHPQMREVTMPLLAAFRALVPVLFDDVGEAADVWTTELGDTQ